MCGRWAGLGWAGLAGLGWAGPVTPSSEQQTGPRGWGNSEREEEESWDQLTLLTPSLLRCPQSSSQTNTSQQPPVQGTDGDRAAAAEASSTTAAGTRRRGRVSPRAHVSRVPRQPRPAPECRGSVALVAVWRRSSARRRGSPVPVSASHRHQEFIRSSSSTQSRATQPSMSTVAAPGPALAPAPAPAPGTHTSQMFNLKWRNYQHHMLAVFDKAWAH